MGQSMKATLKYPSESNWSQIVGGEPTFKSAFIIATPEINLPFCVVVVYNW